MLPFPRNMVRRVLTLSCLVLACTHAAPAAADALDALGPDFEGGWNRIFVRLLRSPAVEPDSQRAIRRRCEEIARLEPARRGTSIARQALVLERAWKPGDKQLRVEAAAAESTGRALQAAGLLREAPANFAEALRRYQRLRESRREAWVLGSIGACWFAAGEYDSSLAYSSRALARRRAIGDSSLVGNSLYDIAGAYLRRGDTERAEAALRSCLRARASTGEAAKLGSTHSLLSVALISRSRPDEALAHSDSSVAWLGDGRDPRRLAEALANRARVLLELDARRAAGEAAERAASLAESLGVTATLVAAQLQLAQLDLRELRLSDATDRFGLVRALAPERSLTWAQALNGLGQAAYLSGDIVAARTHLASLPLLADSLGDRPLGKAARVNLSGVEMETGLLASAGQHADEALALAVAQEDSAGVEECAIRLSELAMARRDPAGARRWLTRALSARPRRNPARSLVIENDLAVAEIRDGAISQARARLRDVEARAAAIDEPSVRSIARTNLADLAGRAGDWAEAQRLGHEVITAIDSLRAGITTESQRVAYQASRFDEYAWFVQFLMRRERAEPGRGYAQEAFAVAERGRARALVARLAGSSRLAAGMQAPGLREVQARLGPGEAVLALSIGDSTSTAWLVTSREWTTRELAPATTLVAAIERARTRIASGAPPDSAWLPLGALLVSPLAKPLAGVKRLRIVADGPLLRVPFHVLPVRPGRAGRLGDRMASSFLPACALLDRTPAPPRTGPAVLVGDVPYDDFAAETPGGTLLHALPSTSEELASLARLVADTTTLVLRGASANRESVVAAIEAHPSPRLLHFAVHGYASPRDPDGSCLWLAPSAEGAPIGRLGVADLRGLDLSGTHVTLSACESGLGALREGEGPMGLARGFLASGASSVLASLWKVDDKATSVLMADFYEGVLRLGLPRDAALARARARAIADPELEQLGAWAAFVLIGEPEPLSPAAGGSTSAR